MQRRVHQKKKKNSETSCESSIVPVALAPNTMHFPLDMNCTIIIYYFFKIYSFLIYLFITAKVSRWA